MNRILEQILPRIQKPARYTGGEFGEVVKNKKTVDVRFALCFPDTYEIGMSNLGLRILYGVLNEMDGVWCERSFAPWGDMETEMRKEEIPLFALESGDPLSDFDILGFSVGYEMSYTNVLNMLDLSGIPLHSKDRTESDPIIIAGGTCAYNPEPLSDFIDIFSLGEGEEALPELVELYRVKVREDWSREEFLKNAAQIPGMYVPSLYHVEYRDNGEIASVQALSGAPEIVTKRAVRDFNHAYFPVHTIVPSTEIVHDRVALELFRGCIRGCRFCQAGFAYRPVRCREVSTLTEQGIESCKASGYQEITLSSLSSSDYLGLEDLCDQLLEYCEPRDIGLSLPSLRVDNFSTDLMERLQHVKKSSLTFAPEAGTQRLRDVINKNVTEEDLMKTCRTAFSGGWSAIKLYFMLGLPTETDEDVLGIADLANKVYEIWRECTPNRSRGVRITVSTSCFVPKPHTPFQWVGQISMDEYRRRVALLREHMRNHAIVYNWHDSDTSFLEAVMSRGDRRICAVLEKAWENGAKLDSWNEYFKYEAWTAAFESCGIDPTQYANRERRTDEVLPWQHLSTGVTQKFFLREWEQAKKGLITPDCRKQCMGCGANRLLNGGACDV